MADLKVWGIHTFNDSLFLDKNVIAIGWYELGDITDIQNDKEALKAKYPTVYKNAKPGSIAGCVGQIIRFINECSIGDYVIFPSKIDRKINIGIVESEAYYDADGGEYPRRHDVKWIKKGIPRTTFSQAALYEIGSAMTFFSVKNNTDEFLNILDSNVKLSTNETDDEQDIIKFQADSVVEQTQDFVLKQLRTQMKGYPLEDVVENLLQAMGYNTRHSPKGGDRGIDIICYKGELPPRIVVQVKSYDHDVAEREIQALAGAKNQCDYGLFVTLSDYTENAKKYLEFHTDIRGINGYELVALLLQYYDKLEDKYKRLFPLKQIFVPVENEEE